MRASCLSWPVVSCPVLSPASLCCFLPSRFTSPHQSHRLCRLALLAPPPSVIFVLTLVVVVLRRHPECQALIHRPPTTTATATAATKASKSKGKGKGKGKGEQGAESSATADAFDFATEDPAVALREGAVTSLWEVAALQRHYFPSVSTLARGLETSAPEDPKSPSPFMAAGGGLDELAAITYAALFAQEAKEKKGRPRGARGGEEEVALVFQPPKRPGALFQPGDCFDGLFALTCPVAAAQEA